MHQPARRIEPIRRHLRTRAHTVGEGVLDNATVPGKDHCIPVVAPVNASRVTEARLVPLAYPTDDNN